jgi:hypothetical protein
MHTVTQAIINTIEEALKEFGRYSYYDKGADEVMENNTLLIRQLPQTDRLTVVKELMDYEHGQNYLASFQGDFEVGDEFMSDEEAEALYAIIEGEPTTATPVQVPMMTMSQILGKPPVQHTPKNTKPNGMPLELANEQAEARQRILKEREEPK